MPCVMETCSAISFFKIISFCLFRAMAWSWTSLAIIVAHSIMCSSTFSAVCLSILTTLPQSTTTLENTTPQETSTQTSPAITGCLYEEAPVTTLPLGESYFDGCVYCYCSYDGDGFCDDLCVTLPCPDEACPLPHCVDAELMPGGCCPECPNGEFYYRSGCPPKLFSPHLPQFRIETSE